MKINKNTFEEKHYIKYVGVLIDSSLSWKYQISNITKEISREFVLCTTCKCDEKCLL